ncbi:MAG: deaminase [Acidobacteriia bacterium 12-62-4]|nr:MAG: deaminase [Acidobacteriia bacterium 12-62-4]
MRCSSHWHFPASSTATFIATEDDSIEWLSALGDPEESSYPAFIAEVGALAMGSATYEWILGHAAEAEATVGSAWPYTQPTWVFSNRELPLLEGADIRIVRGDVRPVHAAMREAAGGKNIWVVGGGELVGQFLDAGLLDEIVVQVGSVTLGQGKPLMPRRVINPPLRLVSAKQMGTGFVELRYAVPAM